MQAFTDQMANCKQECEAIEKRSKATEDKVGINNEILIKLEKEMEQVHGELGTVTAGMTTLISENK